MSWQRARLSDIRLWDVSAFVLGACLAPWIVHLLPFGDEELIALTFVLVAGGAVIVVRRYLPWTGLRTARWPRLAVVLPLVLCGLGLVVQADYVAFFAATDEALVHAPLVIDVDVVDDDHPCAAETMGQRTCTIEGRKHRGKPCYSPRAWDELVARQQRQRAACAAHRREQQRALDQRAGRQQLASLDARARARRKELGWAAAGGGVGLCLLLVGGWVDRRWRRQTSRPEGEAGLASGPGQQNPP